jgi:hypothetical protein
MWYFYRSANVVRTVKLRSVWARHVARLVETIRKLLKIPPVGRPEEEDQK